MRWHSEAGSGEGVPSGKHGADDSERTQERGSLGSIIRTDAIYGLRRHFEVNPLEDSTSKVKKPQVEGQHISTNRKVR